MVRIGIIALLLTGCAANAPVVQPCPAIPPLAVVCPAWPLDDDPTEPPDSPVRLQAAYLDLLADLKEAERAHSGCVALADLWRDAWDDCAR